MITLEARIVGDTPALFGDGAVSEGESTVQSTAMAA
jgi:hypothetical protein